MDVLLAASSDLFWVSVVFFVALGACHLFLIRLYPLTLKQWKLVEFMWVGLALVSIFGIVQEARFYRSSIGVEQSRNHAMAKIIALENWFEVNREFACDDNGGDPKFLPLCRWMKVKNSDLQLILANEEFPFDVPANFLVGINGNLNGLGSADRVVVTDLHSEYGQAKEQYFEAVREGQRSRFSALLVALAPMIFAIAVAIKFTKVTGEYLLTK